LTTPAGFIFYLANYFCGIPHIVRNEAIKHLDWQSRDCPSLGPVYTAQNFCKRKEMHGMKNMGFEYLWWQCFNCLKISASLQYSKLHNIFIGVHSTWYQIMHFEIATPNYFILFSAS
jgi:hypothetical protein